MDCTAPAPLRQQSFLDDPPKRAPKPPSHVADTSREAATAAAPRAPSRRQILLAIIRGQGAKGATIDELQAVTGMLVQTICPAVHSLAEAGELQDSGRRRPTRTGNAAKVWVVVEAAS